MFNQYLFCKAQRNFGIVLLGVVWSLSEVTRYFYYVTNLLSFEFAALKWCRYNFFLVLYPLGVLVFLFNHFKVKSLLLFKKIFLNHFHKKGEIVCILMAARYVDVMNVRADYSFYLPNVLNFSYDFYWILWIWVLLYIPGYRLIY